MLATSRVKVEANKLYAFVDFVGSYSYEASVIPRAVFSSARGCSTNVSVSYPEAFSVLSGS